MGCMTLGDTAAGFVVVNPEGALWTLREKLPESATARNAYMKVQQSSNWVPYLALWHPSTPPKGVSSVVTLNRLTIWDIPFSGAEFPSCEPSKVRVNGYFRYHKAQ
jgi:hypothetical protein